jgi:hypothetical protein
MNLDPCEGTVKMGDQARCGIPFPLVEEMGNTMKPDGMETWIAEEDLYKVFGSRIPLFNGSDIFLQTF